MSSWTCGTCGGENYTVPGTCSECGAAPLMRLVDVTHHTAPASIRDPGDRPGKIQAALEQSVERDAQIVEATEELISTIRAHEQEIREHANVVALQSEMISRLLTATATLTKAITDLNFYLEFANAHHLTESDKDALATKETHQRL